MLYNFLLMCFKFSIYLGFGALFLVLGANLVNLVCFIISEVLAGILIFINFTIGRFL